MTDDDLPLYQRAAEFIYALGWRPHCDAQHTNLRDALPQLRALLTSPAADGGPVFPIQDAQAIHAKAAAAILGITDTAERDEVYTRARAAAVSGMSLLDYFAAHAPEAPADFDWADGERDSLQRMTRWRYGYAAAMLKAKAELTP